MEYMASGLGIARGRTRPDWRQREWQPDQRERVPLESRARVLWAVCASRCCRVTGLTRGRWPLLLFFASCPRPSSSPRSLSPRPPVPFNPPELPAPLIPVVAHDVLHSPFRRSLRLARHPGSSCRVYRRDPFRDLHRTHPSFATTSPRCLTVLSAVLGRQAHLGQHRCRLLQRRHCPL